MKKFVISFTISLFAGLLAILLFVVIADPFYHYHEPIFGEAYMDNALYQTPGAATNFKYDSVIVGSSMTENFRESWFEEMNLKLLKLSYSGAEFGDYKRIYDMAFSSGNEINLVITDINGFQLMSDVDAVYNEYPAYLYDGITFSDVKYIFNNDVFWTAAGRTVEKALFNQLKKDDSYTWEEPELFSESRARFDYDHFKESLNRTIAEGGYIKDSDEIRLELARANMKSLIDSVKEHSDVTFVFYLPAYSSLYWNELVDEGDAELVLNMYGMAMEMLLDCENVIVFDFQDNLEIINDLSRYRDVSHHDPDVNRFEFECIRDTILQSGDYVNEYRVTKDNMGQHLERVRQNIRQTVIK